MADAESAPPEAADAKTSNAAAADRLPHVVRSLIDLARLVHALPRSDIQVESSIRINFDVHTHSAPLFLKFYDAMCASDEGKAIVRDFVERMQHLARTRFEVWIEADEERSLQHAMAIGNAASKLLCEQSLCERP